MDIFKFINPEEPTKMAQGELINNIDSKLWIERYRPLSEFELTGNVESELHLLLPIGSFVSHVESTEIMIVENHQINEKLNSPTTVTVSGRSFESFFENRIIGSNKTWPTEATANDEYMLPFDYSWNQAVKMIADHVEIPLLFEAGDGIPYLDVLTDIMSTTGESVDRSIPRGDLHSRLLELLAIDDLGIKVKRPGLDVNMSAIVHSGRDLTQQVVFAYNTGEIENADYLWSNKLFKNAALVTGRWFETVVRLSPTGYNRKMMFIDASDIDGAYSEAPTGTLRDTLIQMMAARATSILNAQKDISLVKAELNKETMKYQYRKDYQVGDVVGINDPYNKLSKMRVTEYVEIEDENGESGYPTLSII